MTIAELRAGRIELVPQLPGIYVVMRETLEPPIFLTRSPAGKFKAKDPTVNVSSLESKWVENAQVLYVGKAGGGGHRNQGCLRRRVGLLVEFGAGRPVPHWGGRYLWQVDGSDDFLMAWKALLAGTSPRENERDLLRRFHEAHNGRLPLANLKD